MPAVGADVFAMIVEDALVYSKRDHRLDWLRHVSLSESSLACVIRYDPDMIVTTWNFHPAAIDFALEAVYLSRDQCKPRPALSLLLQTPSDRRTT